MKEYNEFKNSKYQQILINYSFKTLELLFYSLAVAFILHFLRQKNRKFI